MKFSYILHPNNYKQLEFTDIEGRIFNAALINDVFNIFFGLIYNDQTIGKPFNFHIELISEDRETPLDCLLHIELILNSRDEDLTQMRDQFLIELPKFCNTPLSEINIYYKAV